MLHSIDVESSDDFSDDYDPSFSTTPSPTSPQHSNSSVRPVVWLSVLS